MARLTEEQWEAVRIAYEVEGLSFGELETKYGVHKSNISRRAKKDGWNQEKTQRLISATVENQKENFLIRNETQQLNATTQRAVQSEVFNRLAFEIQNNADMQDIRDKAMQMLAAVDRPSDLKAIMEIVKAQREAHLGKSPNTAIQINNAAPSEIRRIIIDPSHGNCNA